MLLNILAVGDIVGEGGQDILARRLRELQREHDIHFTVVNGENASGVGLTPRQARGLYDAGADVITLGNHTWNRIQIADFLDKDPLHSPPGQLRRSGTRPWLWGVRRTQGAENRRHEPDGTPGAQLQSGQPLQGGQSDSALP